ncbi:MAG: twin-arginine translocase subunit TatC [Actinomycetota bacterium]|nr:MAG: twin-arginine translocase subunit TatC [Actinomycetota bacterium]
MDKKNKNKKITIKKIFKRGSKRAKDTQKEMPFIDHLEELRKRIIVVLAVFVVLFGAAYPFHNTLLGLLTKPLENKELVFLDITEPFLVNIKIAFIAAVMVIMPLLVFQIISFAFPAFSKKIKNRIIPMTILFFILFYGGVAFCYFFMIPIAVNWLISQGADLEQTLSVTKYVSFIGWFLVGAGVIFELPMILVFLIKINILTIKQLRRQWRVVYIVILLLCAIITPDWSPVTMGVLAAPMILLYELALLLARFL